LTGYDISPAMLAGARAKRIYAELREGDLLTLLASDARCWKLIVAGGSLPWFGALEAVFGLAHSRLSPGGRFIFSLADMATFTADGAAHPDVGWRLARGGCHVHRRDYIERALTTAGLVAHRFESEILCQEAEVPLPGWIFVAGRDEAQESGR
jgi:predicted TPR repeat methyltransferase